MRVVAGMLGGRSFEAPSGHRTHPMSDKIRGALFNILGDIEGLELLDAFGGSGAVGIEAISRGAARVTIIENDIAATATIKQNVEKLSIQDACKVIRANAGTWSANNPDARFDVVICDPPYEHIQPALLLKLATHTKLDGIVVYSLPPHTQLELPSSYKLLASKNYGDATLVFYRRTE